MPVIIEVVARIADSIIDVAHLAPGQPYQIGTVAIPAEATRTCATHRVGLVVITMTREVRLDQRVQRPHIERTPFVYTLVSLAAHLSIWGLALSFAPLERLEPPARVPYARLSHVLSKEPMPERTVVIPAVADPEQRVNTARVAAATKKLAKQVDRIDVRRHLENIGPRYDEDRANAEGFGGDLRLTRPGSVATGAYETVVTGVGAGDFYDPFIKTDPSEKTTQRILEATAKAGASARRGDCPPVHRIARMVKRLDMEQYNSVFLADEDIAYCLTQPLPPRML